MSAKHKLTFLTPVLITAMHKFKTEHRRLLMLKIRHVAIYRIFENIL